MAEGDGVVVATGAVAGAVTSFAASVGDVGGAVGAPV
jgi:hypothetical protein